MRPRLRRHLGPDVGWIVTVRYRCPLSMCTWFHEYVASDSAPECPADVLLWTASIWAFMPDRVGRSLSVIQVIDAHMSTHSPVEWMTELRQLQARAEDAEAERDRLRTTTQRLAEFTIAVDAVTSPRMPTHAEVQATRALLLDAAGGDVDV